MLRECGDRHEAARGGPRGVMDWGLPIKLPKCRFLRLLPLFVILVMAARCDGCKVEQCTVDYDDAREAAGISDPEPTLECCRLLHRYMTCIRATGRTCRGNLHYHSTLSLLNHVITEFNCPRLLAVSTVAPGAVAAGRTPVPSSSAAPPATLPPTAPHKHHACAFHGQHRFRHCGLFGDPHLKTFNDEYQTCRVRGAWPLIDNPYLAVQVTNDPVVNGSPATATTKVTILVRGRSTTCAQEKTYEATSDAPLPSTFIDGTRGSGRDSNVLLTVDETDGHVEIYIRYIETTLVVRLVGRYLAFSARLPEVLVRIEDDSLQLCVRGCPPSERLDAVAARGHALPRELAVAKCRRTAQNGEGYVTNEVNNNLTEYYLDWCVFDVMTTGVGSTADDFTAAAHLAQADVRRLDPASLKNRNVSVLRPGAASGAAPAVVSLAALAAMLSTRSL